MMASDQPGATERLRDVCDRISAAAALARRHADEIALVAVSKTVDAAAIVPLIAAGQRRFGENRVQEAAAKWPTLKARFPDVELHMVGQLQSNKAAEAVALFDVIHSLDRPSLVAALVKAMAETGRQVPCFIQVNLAEETQKGGCPVDGIADLIRFAQASGITLAGLMTVPPATLEPAPYFALLAKLAADHGLRDIPNGISGGLSMGMSADFETAVMLGATHVRVGSALFGGRT